MHPPPLSYSLSAFQQQYSKCLGKHYGLGDLNVTNKTNFLPFLPSLIDRLLKVLYMMETHAINKDKSNN
jgi:hypothetical protein